jgi:hypothetical protein
MPASDAEIVVLATKDKMHHFRPVEEHFRERFVYEPTCDPRRILSFNPKLVVTFDEHYCELANAIGALRASGVLTLQIMDGILEWRRTWDYTRNGRPVDGATIPLNQPVISHKIACLGKRDCRLLESWGNRGKCEIVGAPRMDALLNKAKARPSNPAHQGRHRRVLVMTARTPAFTESQLAITKDSLKDLRDYFSANKRVEVIWRLSGNLAAEVGVPKTDSAVDLHTAMESADAVITTPSTAILESMLLGKPVAQLDYHCTPHYFETAWNIYAREHIEPVVEELLNPPAARRSYQDYLLHDQLACASPAADRLIFLVERLLSLARENGGSKAKLPYRILPETHEAPGYTLPLENLKEFYPDFPMPTSSDLFQLRAELASARGCIEVLYARNAHLERRLAQIPGYTLLRRLKKLTRRLG